MSICAVPGCKISILKRSVLAAPRQLTRFECKLMKSGFGASGIVCRNHVPCCVEGCRKAGELQPRIYDCVEHGIPLLHSFSQQQRSVSVPPVLICETHATRKPLKTINLLPNESVLQGLSFVFGRGHHSKGNHDCYLVDKTVLSVVIIDNTVDKLTVKAIRLAAKRTAGQLASHRHQLCHTCRIP